MEALIKSGMQIAQTDFSSGGCRPRDCMKMTQEYLMYFKEFSCKMGSPPVGGGVGEADRGADRQTGKYASKMRAAS